MAVVDYRPDGFPFLPRFAVVDVTGWQSRSSSILCDVCLDATVECSSPIPRRRSNYALNDDNGRASSKR